MTHNPPALDDLNGTRFCIVLMSVLAANTQKVKLTPIYGVARTSTQGLVVEEASGSQHAVPASALASILPSDGTELLKDAAYYVVVKVAGLADGAARGGLGA